MGHKTKQKDMNMREQHVCLGRNDKQEKGWVRIAECILCMYKIVNELI